MVRNFAVAQVVPKICSISPWYAVWVHCAQVDFLGLIKFPEVSLTEEVKRTERIIRLAETRRNFFLFFFSFQMRRRDQCYLLLSPYVPWEEHRVVYSANLEKGKKHSLTRALMSD